MKKTILILLFLMVIVCSYGQTKKQKNYFPVWTFQHKNVNIHGLSLGLISPQKSTTKSNGLKIELIGLGFLSPLIPQTPNERNWENANKEYMQRTNGINLSGTGSVGNNTTNGVSLGLIGQLVYKTNGVSASIFNLAIRHNGFQLGMFSFANRMKGVQLGLFNTSEKTKGIQIGIWNTNEKRSLPIINWNFKTKNK